MKMEMNHIFRKFVVFGDLFHALVSRAKKFLQTSLNYVKNKMQKIK